MPRIGKPAPPEPPPREPKVPKPPAWRSEMDDIERWREEELRRAGYSSLNALTLARTDCDLHVACDLRLQGCKQQLALRILL